MLTEDLRVELKKEKRKKALANLKMELFKIRQRYRRIQRRLFLTYFCGFNYKSNGFCNLTILFY